MRRLHWGNRVSGQALLHQVAPPLIESGAIVPYPVGTSNYHFEMALVVAIGAYGFRVKESDAASRDLR